MDTMFMNSENSKALQGVVRLFLLLYENNANQTSYNQYCHVTVEIKNYNVMIDGNNVIIDENFLISQ